MCDLHVKTLSSVAFLYFCAALLGIGNDIEWRTICLTPGDSEQVIYLANHCYHLHDVFSNSS